MEKFKSSKIDYPKNNSFDKFLKRKGIKLHKELYDVLKYLLVPIERKIVPNIVIDNGEVNIVSGKERSNLLREHRKAIKKQKIVRIAAATTLSVVLASGVISTIAGVADKISKDKAYEEWRINQILKDGGYESTDYATGEKIYLPSQGVDMKKYSRNAYEEQLKNEEMGRGR